MICSKKRGFALPTVLIASVIMLTVLLVAVTATAAVRTSLKTQYYNQLSQSASDAGLAYAKACLDANNGVPLWSSTNPLKPNTDCSGIQLSGFTCPAGTTDSRCYVTYGDNISSSFSISMPDVDTNGIASSVNSVGTVNLLRTSNHSTWRSYTQSSSEKVNMPTVSVLVVAGGGGGGSFGGGGGGGGVVSNSSFALSSQSYNVVIGAGGAGGKYSDTGMPGQNGKNSSLIANSIVPYGSSALSAGKSCQSLKLDGINTDGVYWIDPDGSGGNSAFQAYCDMTYNGGGWTMLMKATRGTTFNYNASYWTTNNTLNTSDLSTNDGDAKFRSFNEMNLTDIMARWPDVNNERWLNNNIWSNITALTGFNQFKYFGNHNQSSYWSSNFSSQAVQSTSNYGPSALGTKLGDLGGSANGGARWGYRFNENGAGDFGSDDVGGGIGVRHAGYLYSAGDWYSCCGTAGMNRSARVEVYGRNMNDNPDITSSIVAIGGGGGGARGYNYQSYSGANGGSGGGSSMGNTGSAAAGGSGVAGQGNNGGQGRIGTAPHLHGGGGGAGGVGGTAVAPNAGSGGDGAQNSISGTLVYYGAGGGGGTYTDGTYVTGKGGRFGGGDGQSVVGSAGGNGVANTGGGGGGGGYTGAGGDGGSGIVIISYPTGSLVATGGTITQVGKNTVHTFTTNGVFAVSPVTKSVKLLVVGGGGGGGFNAGAGGGAGGVIYYDSYKVTSTSYSINVGDGGTGATIDGGSGGSGNASTFESVYAYGGGGGKSSAGDGISGASGGGGAYTGNGGVSNYSTQGKAGGNGNGQDGSLRAGGGGGGAGTSGQNTVSSSVPGKGGDGLSFAITGTATYYGGGGGGAAHVGSSGAGGAGGGGAGGLGDWPNACYAGRNGYNGTSNTGGGGGAGGGGGCIGGNGGSGVVIISYPTGSMTATGGTITTSGGYTIHRFTSSGTFTVGTGYVKALVVGGGGGSGGGGNTGYHSGGGGGGGVAYTDYQMVSNGSYDIIVGSGGGAGSQVGDTGDCGGDGGNSVFGTLYAIGGGGGGGGGGNNACNSRNGQYGGSGGGGALYSGAGGAGTSGQGNAGGSGQSTYGAGGAGGGAGSAGGSAASNVGGNAGNGVAYSISGSSVYYGGGGAARGNTTNGSAGSAGGTAVNTAGANGVGAGGGGIQSTSGYPGGSGVVVISYPTGSITATGGTVTTNGGNTIHTFTKSGRFVIGTTNTVSVLVVGGGGGGGGFGGGGAGGGVIYNSAYPVSANTYYVDVGAGGAGDSYNTGRGGISGGNSVFDNLVAYGGGGGGSRACPSTCNGFPGRNGGSGGGGSPSDAGSVGTPGYASPTGQGNNGGTGGNFGWGGAGGGGAGAVGANASGNNGGNGGNGVAYSISGASTYYGGGGGGCSHSTNTVGTGGSGGGGNGNKDTAGGNGYAGTNGLGGGGGGGGAGSYVGGNGGNGVVIISYPTGSLNATGGTITTSGGNTIHTFTSGGLFTIFNTVASGQSLNNNLVSYWKLDESSGNPADSVGGYSATNSNVNYVAGKINNGASYNGSTSYTEVSSSSGVTFTNKLTISAWVKPASYVHAYTDRGIVSKNGGGGNDESFLLTHLGDTSSTVDSWGGFVVIGGNGNEKWINGTSEPVPGNWYHVVMTYDGSYQKLYVNGVPEKIVPLSGNIALTPVNMVIGARGLSGSTPSRVFNGVIDEVSYWNKALTSSEINYLYNSGNGRQYQF